MTLQEYLEKNKIGICEMAKQTGFTQPCCSMWAAGQRIPSRENMQKIFAYTNGEVTPNDFYSINENEKELNHE